MKALRTELQGLSGGAALRRLLAELKREHDADAAWFMRFVRPRAGEGVFLVDVVADGPAGWPEAMSVLEGMDISPMGLEAGEASGVNRFDLRMVEETPAAIRASFWDPFGLDSSMACNFVSNRRSVGNLSVLRVKGRPRFTAADVRRATRDLAMLRDLCDALIKRGAAPQTDEAVCILTPDGSELFRSVRMSAEDQLREALARVVPTLEELPAVRMVGNHLVRFEPLQDASAGPVIVARAVVTDPLELPVVMALSKIKRKVAEHAARGATVPEIARHLEKSPETIRAHLKDVYRRLGVSTRVELAEAVSGIFS